jgi:hypothetical protein
VGGGWGLGGSVWLVLWIAFLKWTFWRRNGCLFFLKIVAKSLSGFNDEPCMIDFTGTLVARCRVCSIRIIDYPQPSNPRYMALLRVKMTVRVEWVCI